MKRDLLTSALALVLLASALAAAAMCYKFLRMSQQNRAMQETVVRINQRRALVSNFMVELNEYGLRNSAINPLLDQMNVRMRLTTNAVSVPVAR